MIDYEVKEKLEGIFTAIQEISFNNSADSQGYYVKILFSNFQDAKTQIRDYPIDSATLMKYEDGSGTILIPQINSVEMKDKLEKLYAQAQRMRRPSY